MRVPQDISVIGYDDIPLASYFDPPLTTIQQPVGEFGQCAARFLIKAVQNPDHTLEQMRLNAQLVERSSCTPLHS